MDTVPVPVVTAAAPAAPRNDPQYVAYLEERIAALEARIPDTKLLSNKFMTRAWTVWGHYFVAQLVITAVLWALIMVVGVLFSLIFGLGMAGLVSNLPAN